MENNLQIIREAVIKAVPNILKLEFGCEFVDEETGYKFTFIGNGLLRHNSGKIVKYDRIDGYASRKLGRPIRLADVLVAIGLEKFHNDDRISEIIYGYTHSWNLLKDDLSLQSPETLEFLARLLEQGLIKQ